MLAKAQFPQLPGWLVADGTDAIPAQMRALGVRKDDLEVDFVSRRRPELVTDLLLQCLETADGHLPDQGLLLKMPVGFRIQALLNLAGLVDQRPFSWMMLCEYEGCSKESEFELQLRQILEAANPAWDQETIDVVIGGHKLQVGRPTAADQMRWLAAGDFATTEMLRALIRTPTLDELLARGIREEALIAAIDAAMDDFDPLPGFHLTVVCPHCGSGNNVFPDLAGAALERLARRQQLVIEEVHRLARSYHWSEPQILELPEWRRRSYLKLIEEGTA